MWLKLKLVLVFGFLKGFFFLGLSVLPPAERFAAVPPSSEGRVLAAASSCFCLAMSDSWMIAVSSKIESERVTLASRWSLA